MNNRFLIFSLILGLGSLSAADTIIVESRSGGQNFEGYSEPAGQWLNSNTPVETSKSSAEGLEASATIGSRKATVNPDSAPAAQVVSAARFTPPLSAPGEYHVYITFPRAANATPLDVYVKHAGGEETRKIMQDGWGAQGSPNGNQWINVGQYKLEPGGKNYVELRVTGATGAAAPANAAQAYADAVRFSTEAVSSAVNPTGAAAGRAKQQTPAANSGSAAQTASAEFAWAPSLGDARARARDAGKNVLVWFYSPGSSRSSDYEANVLNDARVRTAIARRYVPVRVNLDTEGPLAAQLQVFRAGTIGLYNASTGAALGQITETPATEDLIQRLNR